MKVVFFSILSYQNGVHNFLSDRENLNKSNYRATQKKEQGQINMKSESHKFLLGYRSAEVKSLRNLF